MTTKRSIFTSLETDPVVQQVAQGFLNGLPDKLQKIIADCIAGDWKAVKADLHTYKGACAMMSLKELSDRFRKLEEQVLNGETDEVLAGLRELHEMCGE